MLLVNTFQLNFSIFIQRETKCFDSNDQNIQLKNFAQVDNMQRNQKNQICKMNANENIDVEFEKFEIQNDFNRKEIVNIYCAIDHLQIIKKKYFLKVFDQLNYTKSSKRTRLSQNRTIKLTIYQKSNSRTAISRKKFFLKKQKICLNIYISQHTIKYRKLKLFCFDEFLDRKKIKKRLAELKLKNYANVLKILNFTIDDYESLIELKKILKAYRDFNVDLLIITQKIRNAKRLQTIQSLKRNEAYMNFLKKCHIHRLFIDNVDFLRNFNDNFIISTRNFTEIAKELDNSRNFVESRIIKSMMKKIYFKMNSNNVDYKKKYREITTLRRNDRRLNVLIFYFDKNILDLLSLIQNDSTFKMTYIFVNIMQILLLFNFQLN